MQDIVDTLEEVASGVHNNIKPFNASAKRGRVSKSKLNSNDIDDDVEDEMILNDYMEEDDDENVDLFAKVRSQVNSGLENQRRVSILVLDQP
jgi:hypothetical protein